MIFFRMEVIYLKKLIILFVVFFLINVLPEIVYSHPGNTDEQGGHTCRTNCEQWGLNHLEYHYHDVENNYTSQLDYDIGYKEGYEIAFQYASICDLDYEWWWEGPQEYGSGFEAGIENGHEQGLKECYATSYETGIDSGKLDSDNENEYDDSLEENSILDQNYYSDGYSEGYVIKIEEEKKEKSKENQIVEQTHSKRIANEKTTNQTSERDNFETAVTDKYEDNANSVNEYLLTGIFILLLIVALFIDYFKIKRS